MHSDLSTRLSIDSENILRDRFLIYRAVLTSLPLQLFVITYDERKTEFELMVYNNELQQSYKKSIHINRMSLIIIYTKPLLTMKKYIELGEMIYYHFKNKIIGDSYRFFMRRHKASDKDTRRYCSISQLTKAKLLARAKAKEIRKRRRKKRR